MVCLYPHNETFLKYFFKTIFLCAKEYTLGKFTKLLPQKWVDQRREFYLENFQHIILYFVNIMVFWLHILD